MSSSMTLITGTKRSTGGQATGGVWTGWLLSRRAIGLGVIGIGALWMGVVGCRPNGEPVAVAEVERATSIAVTVTVDYAGRRNNERFELTVFSGETVHDVLVRLMGEGVLPVDSTGTGATAFVHSIQGVINEGAGGDNWKYLVNGVLADRSCGDFRVSDGDHIEWIFGEYP